MIIEIKKSKRTISLSFVKTLKIDIAHVIGHIYIYDMLDGQDF